MNGQLLETARSLNAELRLMTRSPIDYNHAANILADHIDCNAYIFGPRGNLIGQAFRFKDICSDWSCIHSLICEEPERIKLKLAKFKETQANLIVEKGHCIFVMSNVECYHLITRTAVIPVYLGNNRAGTVVLARNDGNFSEEDIVLSENTISVLANYAFSIEQDDIEKDIRQRKAVEVAVQVLTHSEQGALRSLISSLNGREGIVVARKLAQEGRFSRSTVVWSLIKMVSAGLISSRSLGTKGTYVKILNDHLLEWAKASQETEIAIRKEIVRESE